MEASTDLIRLKALSDPTRLSIVEFLSKSCCGSATLNDEGGVIGPTAGEVCCHITGVSKVSSTISHHLHELADAGLISMERRGKSMACRLEPEALRATAEYLLRLAEPGEQTCC
jgi:DNA-binding transcriptional ArsR family regulator